MRTSKMEIIVPLTDDERTVLMIAVHGQSMIPIGRWEVPIKSLAAKRYMCRLDDVNYVITAAGVMLITATEKAIDAEIAGHVRVRSSNVC